MSGINELKEKSKKHLEVNEKRKMGLGEIFENQPVGKPDSQKDGKPEIKEPTQLDVQQPKNPIIQTAAHPEVQPAISQTIFPSPQPAGQPLVHPLGNMAAQPDVKPEPQPVRQPTIFSSKQSRNQKIPTCKMTFNLREDIHKAFNDLYANRILQGRATEKSEMICEAIQLLITMEEEQLN
jgi:hypothetical protein